MTAGDKRQPWPLGAALSAVAGLGVASYWARAHSGDLSQWAERGHGVANSPTRRCGAISTIGRGVGTWDVSARRPSHTPHPTEPTQDSGHFTASFAAVTHTSDTSTLLFVSILSESREGCLS